MKRRRLEADESRAMLLETASQLLRERGASRVSIAAVADAAGCAKGLVHYHFKNKGNLWASVADHLASGRASSWSEALTAGSASDAVAASWTLLTEESANGTTRAWFSMCGPDTPIAGQTVKSMDAVFRGTVADALAGLLGSIGVRLRIPTTEAAALLASVIDGIGLQLLRDDPSPDLENVYAAAWLGILSLEA